MCLYRFLTWRAVFSKTLPQSCLCIETQQGAGTENASTLNSMAKLSSTESRSAEASGRVGYASDVVKENQSAETSPLNIDLMFWSDFVSLVNLGLGC